MEGDYKKNHYGGRKCEKLKGNRITASPRSVFLKLRGAYVWINNTYRGVATSLK